MGTTGEEQENLKRGTDMSAPNIGLTAPNSTGRSNALVLMSSRSRTPILKSPPSSSTMARKPSNGSTHVMGSLMHMTVSLLETASFQFSASGDDSSTYITL